jgi:hypothetical protein
MKKSTTIFFLFISLSFCSHAQDMGYRTFDVGAQIMNSPKGYSTALHLAFNAAVHNAFLLCIGYNKSDWKDKGKHELENGRGFGISLGYRYYFLVRPHGFFMGLRTDIWQSKINWSQNTYLGDSKVLAFQPTAEIGYMFLINDLFFITPTISGGYQANISTTGEEVGQGFIPQFGLSAGFKF